jgi:hypothetical protein
MTMAITIDISSRAKTNDDGGLVVESQFPLRAHKIWPCVVIGSDLNILDLTMGALNPVMGAKTSCCPTLVHKCSMPAVAKPFHRWF